MGGFTGALTPTRTGKILECFSGWITNSAVTVDEGLIIQLSHGTGTAPTANATLTGTQDGAQVTGSIQVAATAAADVNIPISMCAVVTGLAISTAIWIDVASKGLTNTTNTLHGTLSAIEL
jgi:hypothetical protein